jgi:hypothetical protein
MPTPTPSPTPRPTPTPEPTSTPALSATNVTATTDSGEMVDIVINGNITSSQISNFTITTKPSFASTIVAFILTGENSTEGFGNMTIPKTVILYGTIPVIFIDGQQVASQDYTQDSNNFYVWYTMHFSTHQIIIRFVMPSTSQASSLGALFAVGITVPEIILLYMVIAVRRLRRKPENA